MEYDRSVAAFESDWPSYAVVEFSDAVGRRAGSIAEAFRLRTGTRSSLHRCLSSTPTIRFLSPGIRVSDSPHAPRASPRFLSTPECPKATRSSGRRRVSGRTWSAEPSRRQRPVGLVPCPRSSAWSGTSTRAVESLGKNLLIRFDNGLVIRTHLRMNGSWHRYRPGERWRRPPSRARLVLEVPGAVAVCFDAPVVELLEERAEPLHAPLAGLGPDILTPDFDADEAIRRLRDPDASTARSPRRFSTSGRWRGSATSTRTNHSGSSGSHRSRGSPISMIRL